MASSDRQTAENMSFELVNDRLEIERAEERLMDALARFGYPEASRFALRLAFEEAISNAFNHGHRGLPENTPVGIEFGVDDRTVTLRVADKGKGFDPEAVPDPTDDTNLMKPTGRGLLLIRAYMTSVGFNASGNEIQMEYRRPS